MLKREARPALHHQVGVVPLGNPADAVEVVGAEKNTVALGLVDTPRAVPLALGDVREETLISD